MHFFFLDDRCLPRIVIGLISYCLLLAFTIIFLHCTGRIKRLTLQLYIKTRYFLIALSISLCVFTIFRLHFAFILWLISYLILCILNKDWRFQYLSEKTTKLSSLKFKTHCLTCSPINLPANGFWGSIRILHNSRKSIIKILDSDGNNGTGKISLLRKFFPPSIYCAGMLIPAINGIFFGNQYTTTDHILLILLENYILSLSFLGVAYPIIHLIIVNNKAHLLYGCKTLFKVLYALFSLVIFAIITVITLNF